MPTSDGRETINEQLSRKRVDLARVRVTIARAENNGSSFTLGGNSVTQVAYETALRREKQLEREIAQLEARLAGSLTRKGVASTVTTMHS